jgi:hypothetical protein
MDIIPINKIDKLSYLEAVEKIIELNEHLNRFWSSVIGWAPVEAANLLSKSRLDWQVSLSYSMKRWDKPPLQGAEKGDLILAWANLGALVEGTLKLFLSVYYKDYSEDPDSYKDKKGDLLEPDSIKFELLRHFFNKKIWTDKETAGLDDWVLLIQKRRNAIHAFKDRDLGTFEEFKFHTKKYLAFLIYHIRRLPYPDDQYPDLHLE